MFVFFHVGEDIAQPTAMVFSIRDHNPDATIIQVSDKNTPPVPGVSRVFVTEGNRQFLMQWRTNAFAELGLTEPAMYMDTDMIVRHPIDPAAILRGTVAMTRRDFNREAIFNIRQRGQDYSEYEGKTLDEIDHGGLGRVGRPCGNVQRPARQVPGLVRRPRGFARVRQTCRRTTLARSALRLLA